MRVFLIPSISHISSVLYPWRGEGKGFVASDRETQCAVASSSSSSTVKRIDTKILIICSNYWLWLAKSNTHAGAVPSPAASRQVAFLKALTPMTKSAVSA